MKDLGNYECDGQIEMTDHLKSQIKCGAVKDLTLWMNYEVENGQISLIMQTEL